MLSSLVFAPAKKGTVRREGFLTVAANGCLSIRPLLTKEPFQEICFWIAMVTAELGRSIVAAWNNFSGNIVSFAFECSELHVPTYLFHFIKQIEVTIVGTGGV